MALKGLVISLLMLAAPAVAETRWPDQGWQVLPVSSSYGALLDAIGHRARAAAQ